jgi:hypothetical protein
VLAATEGLTLYRAGFSELGRQRYETAIRIFQRAKSRPLAARAAAMVAREEIMIDSPDAVDCMKRARRLVQGVSDPSIVRRVELLDHIAHPSGYAAELAKRKAALALAVAPIATLRAHDLDED